MGRVSELFLDNPVLIKHLRSRLRRAQALPAGAIVLVLCLLIAWYGAITLGFSNGGVHGMTLGLQAILLVVMGASQVAGAVGGVRESSILDFHRISPLPALETVLGFFFGAPCREYLLYALTLPLSLVCVANGSPSFAEFVQEQVALVLIAWAVHGVALLASLVVRKPKATIGPALILAFVFLFNIVGSIYTGGFLSTEDSRLHFYGKPLPGLVFLALNVVPMLVFVLIASTRKMRSERAHALSKPEGLAFLATLSLLLLGAVWDLKDVEALVLVVLYVLVAAGLLTTLTITPGAGEFARGIRRAEREGRRTLSPLDDLSLNRITLAGLGLIVLTAATIAWNVLAGTAAFTGGPFAEGLNPSRTSLAIALGVLVILYFGLAFQYFQLVVPRRAGTLMGLFLFFAWIVPILAGLIARNADLNEQMAIGLIASSPLAGLAMTAGAVPPHVLDAAQIAALTVALLFTFGFYHLVTTQRRRVIRSVHAAPAGGKPKDLVSTVTAF